MRNVASFSALLATFTLIWSAAQIAPVTAGSGTVWATPHDSYSSSVGVLGCKVDTNRIAYWPSSVSCDAICVELSYGGRSVKLLKVDQSGGAFDVSYDAWNYLQTGKGAREQPTAGGAVAMQYRDLDAGECASLIHTDGHRLPLSAANSMNFLASCLDQPGGSWIAKHYQLYNILDPICTWGKDESCDLKDWPNANQASCPSTMGAPVALTSAPVYNIRYPSGQEVAAGSGEPRKDSGAAGGGGIGGGTVKHPVMGGWAVYLMTLVVGHIVL
ncbi:NmrA family protein [Apiospora arundinis]